MSGAEIGLACSVFLASAVECVEALTIVLAVGSTRSWRSALAGTAAAFALLGALVAGLGAGLTSLPVDALRTVVGALLLAFGLHWLRKAVLRASGRKAQHDELRIFEQTAEAAREADAGAGRTGGPAARTSSWDHYSFAVAGQGVLLEGLEVVLIVVALGADRHRTGLAAAAAGAAVVLVIAAGVAAHRPLARVPENAMKFVVGVMLVSYGLFWVVEGLGLHWPGGDGMLAAIVPAVLACAGLCVLALRGARGAVG